MMVFVALSFAEDSPSFAEDQEVAESKHRGKATGNYGNGHGKRKGRSTIDGEEVGAAYAGDDADDDLLEVEERWGGYGRGVGGHRGASSSYGGGGYRRAGYGGGYRGGYGGGYRGGYGGGHGGRGGYYY